MRKKKTVFRQKTPLLSEEKAGVTADAQSLPPSEAAFRAAAGGVTSVFFDGSVVLLRELLFPFL